MGKAEAVEFVKYWKGRGDEKKETQKFWIDLLKNVLEVDKAVHDIEFEKNIETYRNKNNGFIDVWIPKSKVLIEQKSIGVNLDKKGTCAGGVCLTPLEQAVSYMRGFPNGQGPVYLVTSNFEELRIYDTRKHNFIKDTPPDVTIKLEDIPSNLGTLQFLVEDISRPLIESKQVSIEAGKIMGRIHDAVACEFIDPDSDESHHALSVFCTRIMFLMFCEDTGIIGPTVFTDYLVLNKPTATRKALLDLFEWLDTPDSERDPYANPELKAFPYMNGGLFRERTTIPQITDEAYNLILINGCREFDWSNVDPTVFGSIFEGALSHDDRHDGGMHYTSPSNIHKVIDPLFLNDLYSEFNQIKSRPSGSAKTRMLKSFHEKIGNLSFLDPAAGSGNFLTETYICLRELENQVLLELKRDSQTNFEFEELDEVSNSVLVNLSNFHGIEINDFACCVARTALWIAEKQADIRTEKILKRVYPALPLKDYKNITHSNSLQMDWNEVVDASELNYIMGNPPFIGPNCLTPEQKKDRIDILGKKDSHILDYVACWFKKSADYVANHDIKFAFVATNSICQGQQVQPLWEPIFKLGFEIEFAHKSFIWDSQANDKAHVHVVIVGLSRRPSKHTLYSGDESVCVEHINGYLIDAPDSFIAKRNHPLCDVSPMAMGCMPVDHGFLQLDDVEKNEMIRADPEYGKWIRRFSMGSDFIDGTSKYCLWLKGITPKELLHLPLIRQRVELCRQWRESQIQTGDAYKLRDIPHLLRPAKKFNDKPYIAVPSTSSQRRKYIPMGFVADGMIPGNALMFVENGTLYEFGILNSQFHNAWMRITSGRLKSDYRYSSTIVYNNFVWPTPTDEQKNIIEMCAQDILDARSDYNDCTLADMYDPDNEYMFPKLIKAHDALNNAVERAYGVEFNGDEEKIVNHLFSLYNEMATKS